MSIQITSTTDSEKDVTAAIGNLSKADSKEEKSVSRDDSKDESQDETHEDSETSKVENDEDESSDSDNDEENKDESEDKKPKKKGGFQKRIERFQKKLSEKDQELEYWRKEALRAKDPVKQVSDASADAKTQKTVSDGKPKPDSFETHSEYIEALTDWKLEQKDKEREEKQKQTQVKTEYEKQVQSFQSKVQEFSKTAKDFQEVVNEVDDIPLSVGLQEAILSSDVGPNLMYELAKDREELERINSLSAVQAAREIGKIEARLSKADFTQTKEIKTTKAPPPISPVSNKGTSKSTKSPDEMSYAEFKKWRESK